MPPDRTGVTIWTIYDHPSDYPDAFVARRFDGETATPEIMVASDIEALRDEMLRRGLVKLMRADEDDEVIVETWI